jgi:hypothetical protein
MKRKFTKASEDHYWSDSAAPCGICGERISRKNITNHKCNPLFLEKIDRDNELAMDYDIDPNLDIGDEPCDLDNPRIRTIDLFEQTMGIASYPFGTRTYDDRLIEAFILDNYYDAGDLWDNGTGNKPNFAGYVADYLEGCGSRFSRRQFEE